MIVCKQTCVCKQTSKQLCKQLYKQNTLVDVSHFLDHCVDFKIITIMILTERFTIECSVVLVNYNYMYN